MIFLLKCPKCKHNMKYRTNSALGKKRKVCVYCGRSFNVKDRVVEKTI